MWSCQLFDTRTGLLAEPIDIPNVSWSVSVSDCSLSTTKDKGTGEGELNSLTLPWEAVPGEDSAAKCRAIASYKRGLVLSWDGVAVVAGLIGERKDGWLDTSFDIISPMSLLESRYVIQENTFGAATGGTTISSLRWTNLSYRAIACRIVQAATSAKPGGALPLYLPYTNESGSRTREYYGYNVQNNDAAKLLKELTNVNNGPDIQFRPEFTSDQYMRWTLYAGSDSEPKFLGNTPTVALTAFPGGGTAENVYVAHDGATHRVYQTGAGQDQATLGYLAQNLAMVNRLDPYPLVETVKSDSDLDNLNLVKSHANASLNNLDYPICQVTCEVNIADPLNPVKPGLVWAGEPVDLAIEGHPALPDGMYNMRLMEMAGDLGTQVTLIFDVMADPLENL